MSAARFDSPIARFRRGIAGGLLFALVANLCVVASATVAEAAMPHRPVTATTSSSVTPTDYPIPDDAIFVAPDGNNANPGTRDAPLKTATAAVAKAVSGVMTTIVFRQGEYRERVAAGNIAAPVTLQPYPGEQVWFKGSFEVPSAQFIADGNAWRLDDWNPSSVCRPTGPAYDECMGPTTFNDDHPVGGDPQMVFLDGEPMRQVATREEVRAGTFYHDGPNDKTYIGSNPAGRRVEMAAKKSGLHFVAGAEGSIVRGLGFVHYGTSQNEGKEPGALIAQADRVVFENNTVADNAASGLVVNAGGVRVTGNVIADNGFSGVKIHGSANLTFEGNRVQGNNTERLGYYAGNNLGAAGAIATRLVGGVVRDNVFEDNYGTGFWCDMSCVNVTVVRNLARANADHGLRYRLSAQGLIASNVLADNAAAGVDIIGSNRVRAYNNSMIGNGQALLVQEDPRPTCPGAEDTCLTAADLALGVTWDTADITLVNNIFAGGTGAAPLIGTVDHNTAASGRRVGADGMLPAAQVHHNGYSGVSGDTPSTLVQWCRVRGVALQFTTLADFQAATGRDAGSRHQDSSFVVNAAAGDYALIPGSPAVTAGAALPPDVAAAVGVATGGAVRLGALTWPREPVQTELVRNGNLDGASLAPWWPESGTMAAVDAGMLRIDGSAVLQPVGSLKAGRPYTLSFDAKAAADATVQVSVEEGDEPHSTALAESVNLETTLQHFSFPFTATVDSPVTELVVRLSGGVTVQLDGVSLKENTWSVAAQPAATEADALAAAAATGQLVEVLSERGEAREAYATPDGSFTSKEHLQPVRVLVNSQWTPVDTTLVRQADGSIVPMAATVGLRLSAGGTEPLVSMERAGRPMALTWPSALPAPRLEGDTAVYAGVLGADVDLRVRAEPAGFSHVVVVKTAAAARDPRLASIKFGLSAPGLTVSTAEDGTQRAVDQVTGAVVYEAPVPIMWDSTLPAGAAPLSPSRAQTSADAATDPEEAMDEEAVTTPSAEQPGDTSKVASLTTSATASEFVVQPDTALLTAVDTTFPVYIDPMWDTPKASARLMVSSAGWAKYNFEETEGVGRCPRDYPPAGAYCNGWYEKRLFYRIPSGRFAGKTILSAEFTAHETWATSCQARPIDIWLTTAFGAGSTWNSTKDNWTRRLDSRNVAKGFNSKCVQGDVRFNVTGAMREAAKKGWSNTSFGLRARDPDDQLAWKRFGRNASVQVHYNTPPLQPRMGQLSSSPGGACRRPDEPAMMNRLPTLYAKNLTDRDNKGVEGEKLKAQFQIQWTDSGGVKRTRNLGTVAKMAASPQHQSSFSVKVPTGVIPQGVQVNWHVRAYDGRSWSPWSWEGNATSCNFIYDARALPDPVITSNATDGYPALNPADPKQVPSDGVGRYGKFTIAFDSRVTKYAYAMNTNPSEGSAVTRAATASESVTLMPSRAGLNTLFVTAWDGMNNWSTGTYEFWVAPGRAPKAHWKLDEAAGTAQLADSAPKTGTQPRYTATAQGGTTLGGAGVVGGSAAMNGSTGYAATSGQVLDTTKSFAVSAWVKLPETAPAANVSAVTQAGTVKSAFYLKYEPASNRWVFARPVADADTAGHPGAAKTGAVRGVWTHLVGVHDTVAKKLRLYVNGVEATPADFTATPWASTGPLTIGRGLWLGNQTDYWPGSIDEVRVYDRVVTPDEVQDLFQIKPVAMGVWHLNSATGTPPTSPDTAAGTKRPMTLSGAAKITTSFAEVLVATPGGKGGALKLSGANGDYASVNGAMIDSSESFTVSAWVATPGTPTRAMDVLSLPGAYNSAITVRLDPAKQRYVLDVPSKDASGATTAKVEHSTFHQGNYGDWDHIAVAYDAFDGTVTLWVNGFLEDAADADNFSFRHNTRPFAPITSLQLGRALTGGAYPGGRNWAGLIDDVWVLRGAPTQSLVDMLALPTELASIPG